MARERGRKTTAPTRCLSKMSARSKCCLCCRKRRNRPVHHPSNAVPAEELHCVLERALKFAAEKRPEECAPMWPPLLPKSQLRAFQIRSGFPFRPEKTRRLQHSYLRNGVR